MIVFEVTEATIFWRNSSKLILTSTKNKTKMENSLSILLNYSSMKLVCSAFDPLYLCTYINLLLLTISFVLWKNKWFFNWWKFFYNKITKETFKLNSGWYNKDIAKEKTINVEIKKRRCFYNNWSDQCIYNTYVVFIPLVYAIGNFFIPTKKKNHSITSLHYI